MVSNPLLSLSASGTIADRLTFERRRALCRAVPYSTPSGPPSSAQSVCRLNMSEVSTNWNFVFAQTLITDSWTRYAKTLSKSLTGANVFIRSSLKLTHIGDAPAFCSAAYGVGRVAVFAFLNPYTGDPSSEAGMFSIRTSATPHVWTNTVSRSINAGAIIGPVSPIGGTFYFQIFKDGIPRSGIISLAQTQAATYEDMLLAGITWEQLFQAGITWDDLS